MLNDAYIMWQKGYAHGHTGGKVVYTQCRANEQGRHVWRLAREARGCLPPVAQLVHDFWIVVSPLPWCKDQPSGA